MSSTTGATTEKNRVTIRMYDVGFGDCFLLLIPRPRGPIPLKVLIDCGTFSQGRNSLKSVVQSILSGVQEPDGRHRIDVVIATHRHKDHVSGFTQSGWEDVEVKEVWMPWTEEPDDTDARRLRAAQQQIADQLARALSLSRGTPSIAADIAALAVKNESAMQVLWHGFSGDPLRRYLPVKENGKRLFRSPALPGVAIHVLGPSRDQDTIRNLEPPEGQSYIVAASLSEERTAPFKAEQWSYAPARTTHSRHLILDRRTKRAINKANEPLDPLGIAAQMDQAINGTSLVLVFEIGKASLLFPGDAQWGTWEQILADESTRDLLKNIDFYKVGHHASHNGTPIDFVEEILPKKTSSVVSVKKVANWPRIPRAPLLKALADRTSDRVVRSDEVIPKKNPKKWYKFVEDDHACFMEIKIPC